MAKRKFNVTVEIEMVVEIEDDVLQSLLPDFQEVIDPEAEEDDVINRIGEAIALGNYSGEDFVEGVGSLKENAIKCYEDYRSTSCMEDLSG